MTVRVLVVDDNFLYREGLSSLLRRDGVEVAGTVGSGEEAVECSAALRPQVVLMDVTMPGIGGVEGTRRLYRGHPDLAVCALALTEQQNHAFEALCAGARGVVLKTATYADLQATLTIVAAGGAVVSASLAAQLLDDFNVSTAADGLTSRERRLLEQLAHGDAIEAVAQYLDVAPQVVTTELRTALDKLHARHRTDDDGLQGTAVPRRPSPGGLSSSVANQR